MAVLFDSGIFSAVSSAGATLPGALLYWYATGTTTPLATYSDEELTVPNLNPVPADANGRFPAIWLQAAKYKYVLKTAVGVTLVTRNGISGLDPLTKLALTTGAAQIGTASGGTVQSFIDSTNDQLAFGRNTPDSAFDVLPITLTGVYGVGQVWYSEDPVSCAFRTEVISSPNSSVWVSPQGSDNTGDGTMLKPWRQVDYALKNSTATTIRARKNRDGTAGKYLPFALRADTNPTGCAALRHIEAEGPITFQMDADTISQDALASGTFSIATGNIIVDGDTNTVGATVFTWRSAPAATTDILLDPADGREAWGAKLNDKINQFSDTLLATSVVTGLVGAAYVITVKATTPGTAGNSIALAAVSTHAIMTASGATLVGGGAGWTDEGDGTWSYQLTVGGVPPRAVIDNATRDPITGYGLPLSYYGNSRRITFSNQPSAGNTVTINNYLGVASTIIFVASGASGLTQCNIGVNLATTLDNLLALINVNSDYFTCVADSTGSVVRLMSKLNATSHTLTVSISGGVMSLAAQTTGKTELASLTLATGGAVALASRVHGGWYYDSATAKLYVRVENANVQNYKENLDLITGDANATHYCFLYGGRLSMRGDIQFRGTYLSTNYYTPDAATYPTRIWADITNQDRPTCLCSPLGTGMIEHNGVQGVLKGMSGFCTGLDTFHIETSGAHSPISQLMDCASDFAGDPYTFPVIDYPNKNSISPHGAGCVTAIFGGRFGRSIGPEIIGDGKVWFVGCNVSGSLGTGQQQGITSQADSSYWIDTCSVSSNTDGDIVNAGGTVRVYRASYRTSTGALTPYVPA